MRNAAFANDLIEYAIILYLYFIASPRDFRLLLRFICTMSEYKARPYRTIATKTRHW